MHQAALQKRHSGVGAATDLDPVSDKQRCCTVSNNTVCVKFLRVLFRCLCSPPSLEHSVWAVQSVVRVHTLPFKACLAGRAAAGDCRRRTARGGQNFITYDNSNLLVPNVDKLSCVTCSRKFMVWNV